MFCGRKKASSKGALWTLYSHILDGRILRKPDGTRGVVVSSLHHDCLKTRLTPMRLVRWEGSSKPSSVPEEKVRQWLTDAFANESWVPLSIRVAQMNKWVQPTKTQIPALTRQLKVATTKPSKANPSPTSTRTTASTAHMVGGSPSSSNRRTCKALQSMEVALTTTAAHLPKTGSQLEAQGGTAQMPMWKALWSKATHMLNETLSPFIAPVNEVDLTHEIMPSPHISKGLKPRALTTAAKAAATPQASLLVAFDEVALRRMLRSQEASANPL